MWVRLGFILLFLYFVYFIFCFWLACNFKWTVQLFLVVINSHFMIVQIALPLGWKLITYSLIDITSRTGKSLTKLLVQCNFQQLKGHLKSCKYAARRCARLLDSSMIYVVIFGTSLNWNFKLAFDIFNSFDSDMYLMK